MLGKPLCRKLFSPWLPFCIPHLLPSSILYSSGLISLWSGQLYSQTTVSPSFPDSSISHDSWGVRILVPLGTETWPQWMFKFTSTLCSASSHPPAKMGQLGLGVKCQEHLLALLCFFSFRGTIGWTVIPVTSRCPRQARSTPYSSCPSRSAWQLLLR